MPAEMFSKYAGLAVFLIFVSTLVHPAVPGGAVAAVSSAPTRLILISESVIPASVENYHTGVHTAYLDAPSISEIEERRRTCHK